MTDPCIAEFTKRIARIEKARAKGFGFEAEGTLGRSFYSRRMSRRKLDFPVVRPVLTALVLGIALKASLLFQLGIEAYEARVDDLLQGQGFDRVGGLLMQVDPLSAWTARQIVAFTQIGRG
ncbi:MAG: hypothetical protein JXR75_00705 [Rhodobacteraceae bacterium]|nr:hypothetical protein [Paracoccaceae bacterium]